MSRGPLQGAALIVKALEYGPNYLYNPVQLYAKWPMREILQGSLSWHGDVVNLWRCLGEVRADTCRREGSTPNASKCSKLGGITQTAKAHQS